MMFLNVIFTLIKSLIEFGLNLALAFVCLFIQIFFVGIGTDNIEDIYKPYCDGDMLFETRLALEACKIYDDETIIDLAYNNGLKILG